MLGVSQGSSEIFLRVSIIHWIRKEQTTKEKMRQCHIENWLLSQEIRWILTSVCDTEYTHPKNYIERYLPKKTYKKDSRWYPRGSATWLSFDTEYLITYASKKLYREDIHPKKPYKKDSRWYPKGYLTEELGLVICWNYNFMHQPTEQWKYY